MIICSKIVASWWVPSSVLQSRFTLPCCWPGNMEVSCFLIRQEEHDRLNLINYNHFLVPTLVNGAPPFPKPMENNHIYALCDILCVNETEAHLMTKMCVDSLEDCRIACKMILDKGCSSVILTLGEKGALYVNRNNALHIPVPHRVNAVDTTVSLIQSVLYLNTNKLIAFCLHFLSGCWWFIYGSNGLLSSSLSSSFNWWANKTGKHCCLGHRAPPGNTRQLPVKGRITTRNIQLMSRFIIKTL